MSETNGNGADKSKRTDRRRENLAPAWKPGQPGNTRGVQGDPIPKTFTELCREYGAEIDPKARDRTRLQTLQMAIWERARRGDARAARIILDRMDPETRRIALETITAEQGNAMIDRLAKATSLPVPSNGTNGDAR